MIYKNSADDFRTLFVNKIEAETAKAYKLNIDVSWNANSHERSFWFPKSVVCNENGHWSIKNWFANKLEDENTFKGYRMKIECGFQRTEELSK